MLPKRKPGRGQRVALLAPIPLLNAVADATVVIHRLACVERAHERQERCWRYYAELGEKSST